MPGPHYIAVDIGGTKTAVSLITPAGRILGRLPFATRPAERGPTAVLEEITRAVKTLYIRITGASSDEAIAIGASCGGPLDPERGVIGPGGHAPPNLPGWCDVNLTRFFKSRFPALPFHVENDASSLALGEYVFGGGRDCRRLALLLLGTGVGGGFLVDGRLISGATGNACEFGHQVFWIEEAPEVRFGRASHMGSEAEAAVRVANLVNFFDPSRIFFPHEFSLTRSFLNTVAEHVLNPLFDVRAALTKGIPPTDAEDVVILDAQGQGTARCARHEWRFDPRQQILGLGAPRTGLGEGWRTLEDVCSGKGVSARMRGLSCEHMGAEEVFQQAQSGDLSAIRVFEQTALLVAAGLANIALVMRPERIFLCGGVSLCASRVQQEELLRRVRRHLAWLSRDVAPPAVAASRLGPEAQDLSAIAWWCAGERRPASAKIDENERQGQ